MASDDTDKPDQSHEPNEPVRPPSDKSPRHFVSGNLLRLGQLLLQNSEWHRFHQDGPRIKAVLEEITFIEELLTHYLHERPKHSRSAILRDHCLLKTANKMDQIIDWPRTRILAVLLAELVGGSFERKIGDLARDSILDINNGPELLEQRHFIANMVVQGVLICEAQINCDATTAVQLSRFLICELLGGSACIPFVSPDSIQRVIAKRKARAAGNEVSSKIDEVQKKSQVVHGNTTAEEFVKGIEVLTPLEMYTALDLQHRYYGQERLRKAVCLAAYRHLVRLRSVHIDKIPLSKLPPKENLLIRGSTGTGKTFLINLLFNEILKIPSAIIDITSFSETGYVGNDIESIPTRLLMNPICKENVVVAQTGCIAFDEFDKLADPANAQGRQSHISRIGVQRGLLALMDNFGSEMFVPKNLDQPSFRSPKVAYSTANNVFIGIGAFSGWSDLTSERSIGGFHGDTANARVQNYTQDSSPLYEQFGIMPELRGRFQTIAHAADLTREELKAILVNNVIRQHTDSLERQGIGLVVEVEVVNELAQQAMAMKTGCRSLGSVLVQHLQEALFLAFSERAKGQRIRIYREVDGSIGWMVD